ncbi:expressed unknown protein [Seminavis robusta]|uniref:Uncharacterized protein n=1 Tax=Seminavis robusta TaxID=568900 RepID=A0A9N8EZG4_9STRA|nr:expressed unknown protein [Seminavis robusta]|eukprot:Sro2672_g334330.1 n/a (333) ;mRNA; f:8156-9154
MTSLKCRLPRNQVTKETIHNCLMETFGTADPAMQPLALQTVYYAHMNSIPPKEMEPATSWLLALRNPVDRVISAYQYSHPANCRDQELLPNSTKACTNHFLLKATATTRKKGRNQLRNERRQLAKFFVNCFPQSDMELFVQSALSFSKDHNDDDCARLARDYIIGEGFLFPIPHLRYNYHHYQSKVFDVYKGKEWFGIRTEHLATDFTQLNLQLGGKKVGATTDQLQGEPQGKQLKLTHGSEQFRSSSKLSVQSYHRLCCLLEDELSIYRDLIHRVWNLDHTEKDATIHALAEKCGMLLNNDPKNAPGNWNWLVLTEIWNTWKNTTCPTLAG